MRRKLFSSALLLSIAAVATSGFGPAGAPAVPGQEKKVGPPAVDTDKVLRAAQEYAKAVAGAESGDEYFQALEYALQGAGAQQRKRQMANFPADKAGQVRLNTIPQAMPSRTGNTTSPFAQARTANRVTTGDRGGMQATPTWQRNRGRYFTEVLLKQPPAERIFGGVFTSPGEVPECVAVGGSGGFCCTGTLIGPNVVLTAGHCHEGGCAAKIFVGNDSNVPATGRVVNVKTAIRHPGYNALTLANDLAVLILDETLDTTPAPLAATADIEATPFVRLVGYGFTETGVFGVQAKVDVFVATADCAAAGEQSLFGCHPSNELVAGGNGHDSCNGDSGGPAFVLKDGKRHLAGATSRATANSQVACGDGGIYVRVDKYKDWITQVVKDNGGQLAK